MMCNHDLQMTVFVVNNILCFIMACLTGNSCSERNKKAALRYRSTTILKLCAQKNLKNNNKKLRPFWIF